MSRDVRITMKLGGDETVMRQLEKMDKAASSIGTASNKGAVSSASMPPNILSRMSEADRAFYQKSAIGLQSQTEKKTNFQLSEKDYKLLYVDILKGMLEYKKCLEKKHLNGNTLFASW